MDKRQPDFNRFPTGFLLTGAFSAAVALLVWWLLDSGGFWAVLIISLSIGWSVNLAFALLQGLLSRRIGPWAAPVLIVALGLMAGLLIAGALVGNHPLFYFSGSFTTVALALFFGITGTLVFYTRERLHHTRRQLAESELRQSRQEQLLALPGKGRKLYGSRGSCSRILPFSIFGCRGCRVWRSPPHCL